MQEYSFLSSFLYTQSNLVSVIVLFLLYFNKSPFGVKATEQKHYDRIIVSTILVLLADSGMWLINGCTFPYARVFNLLISGLCYALTTLVGLMYVIYIDYRIHRQSVSEMTKRMLPYYAIEIVCLVLLAVNFVPGYELLFWVDEKNIYHRGDCFWLFTLVSFLFIAACTIRVMVASGKETRITAKREYQYLSLFIIPPVIGGTLQLVTGLSFSWSFVTISLLILFIKFQSRQVATDTLTGLNNRRQLENYLDGQINQPDAPQMYAVMLDIDHFKKINDTFGHTVGDDALISAAAVLMDAAQKRDFLARYGGDEFVIITHCVDKRELDPLLINRISDGTARFNGQKIAKYELSFSLGYSRFDPNFDVTADSFIARADTAMYAEKLKKNCE